MRQYEKTLRAMCPVWSVIAAILLTAVEPLPSQKRWSESVLQSVLHGRATDLLHGFSYDRFGGWSCSVGNNFIRFVDDEGLCFVVIRFARYEGNLQQVAQSWWRERQAMACSWNQPQFAFKQLPSGIVIVGQGLGYPFVLHPMMAINFGSQGRQPPGNYREVTAILPGKKTALVVTLLFPPGTPKSKVDDMLQIVRSFRLLPTEKRVCWRQRAVVDPEVGGEAGWIHIPEGFDYRGEIIQQNTKRLPVYFLRKDNMMMRCDHIDLNSSILQTGFGGNATTLLTINGKTSQQPRSIFPQSPRDVARLILGVWQAETEQPWELEEQVELRRSACEKLLEQQARQAFVQQAAVFRHEADYKGLKFAMCARSGQLVRIASIQGVLTLSQRVDHIAATQDCQVAISVITFQFPEAQAEEALGIFTGVMSSIRFNPKAVLSMLERWTKDNIRLNRMVLDMLNEERNFNSRMAKAWTNALSDQTYVKDPETNEIFRVHKQVWETGEFWRDPLWGNLLGGVERDSELERLLREQGWRPLQQSLEGFPE